MKTSFAAGRCEFDVTAPQPEKHIVVVNIDMTNAENLAIVFDDITSRLLSHLRTGDQSFFPYTIE